MCDNQKPPAKKAMLPKCYRPRVVSILHIASKLQVDRVCFHGGKESANFDGKEEEEERNNKTSLLLSLQRRRKNMQYITTSNSIFRTTATTTTTTNNNSDNKYTYTAN